MGAGGGSCRSCDANPASDGISAPETATCLAPHLAPTPDPPTLHPLSPTPHLRPTPAAASNAPPAPARPAMGGATWPWPPVARPAMPILPADSGSGVAGGGNPLQVSTILTVLGALLGLLTLLVLVQRASVRGVKLLKPSTWRSAFSRGECAAHAALLPVAFAGRRGGAWGRLAAGAAGHQQTHLATHPPKLYSHVAGGATAGAGTFLQRQSSKDGLAAPLPVRVAPLLVMMPDDQVGGGPVAPASRCTSWQGIAPYQPAEHHLGAPCPPHADLRVLQALCLQRRHAAGAAPACATRPPATHPLRPAVHPAEPCRCSAPSQWRWMGQSLRRQQPLWMRRTQRHQLSRQGRGRQGPQRRWGRQTPSRWSSFQRLQKKRSRPCCWGIRRARSQQR